MDSHTIQILVSMVSYMAVVILIGAFYAKRANKNSEEYFLGGRSLGPWVTAMSAEASDMSGWLLMGLPGVAYWCGLADALWTAVGLAVGTYINWLIVSKRLRRYSERANNSVTLPEFFSNRFREKKKTIMLIAAAFILIFFAVYASSCFVTCGKLFANLFGLPYKAMMILGAAFVLLYTILGGFLAESVSDFMQAIVMIVALTVVVVIGVVKAGGFPEIIENAKNIDGFFEFMGIASPKTVKVGDVDTQVVANTLPQWGEASKYSLLNVFSAMAWGLGYFGMPQVLLRFMAIRKESELKMSRRIATVWVVISLSVAVFLGIMGRHLFPVAHLTKGGAESIFITLSESFLPSILAGFVMAGILAATISSSDSYLLIAASALSKNIYQGVFKKNATDKQVMTVSRITLLVLTLLGVIIALDENSVIFSIVSFAWAGFGATFGPLMLFSLFWKRINKEGAIAGMISGAGMVFFWKLVIKDVLAKHFIEMGEMLKQLSETIVPENANALIETMKGRSAFYTNLGNALSIYELLPAFIFSSLVIVIVSLMTKAPSKEIEEDFEAVRSGKIQ